jgi:lipopolysaccharide transport system ATP-binding protein
MSDVVIRVENLSKEYRLGVLNYGSLSRDLQSYWAKLRGKEDPNTKVNSSTSEQLKYMTEKILALHDVSFDVKQGEIVGIIGPNGAGKSTLLKIISRVTAPTKGTVKIKGRVASLLEVGTGFHPELTGQENVYLNGTILGMSKKEIDAKFDDIVAFAEVENFIDTPVKRYSSGMFVRLAFAVAAHLEPEILIVDEVLAVGDLKFRKKCLGKMKDISESSGRTILFVSHDMPSIRNICTCGMLLDKGKLVYSGSALDTVKEYLRRAEIVSNTALRWVPPEKNYPFADVVKINRFYIIDENGEIPSSRLFNSKRYDVVIEADLIQSDPRLIFIVAYYDESHTILFATDVYDTGELDFSKIKPGKIKLSVPVPVDILGNRVYEIELICALHHTGWVLPPNNESKIKFDFFRDSDMNPYSSDTRLGSLAPVLKWKISNNADGGIN